MYLLTYDTYQHGKIMNEKEGKP